MKKDTYLLLLLILLCACKNQVVTHAVKDPGNTVRKSKADRGRVDYKYRTLIIEWKIFSFQMEIIHYLYTK